MRDYELRPEFRASIALISPEERDAVRRVFRELRDESVPLVRDGDLAIQKPGGLIVGRPVPGTDLVFCYVPGGVVFFVVDLEREP